MRHWYRYILVLILCASAVSCEKNGINDGQRIGSIVFEFGDGFFTKASLCEDDDMIDRIQVAVYDGDKQVGYAARQFDSKSGAVTVSRVPLGKALDCYAVANVSESIEGMSGADIAGMIVELEDFGPAYLPMYASAEATFAKDNVSMQMELVRPASKVELEKITCDFETPCATSISRIFLMNAPGRHLLGLGDPDDQVFYNEGAFSPEDMLSLGDAASLLYDDVEISLDGNTSHDETFDYYCCPLEDMQEGEGATALVIEAVVDGEPTSYVIPLPSLLPNTKYLIHELVLQTKNPGQNLLDPTIEVSTWGEGENEEVRY